MSALTFTPHTATELPLPSHSGGAGANTRYSQTVFAYGADVGWVRAIYVYDPADPHWEYSSEGISAVDWDVERLRHVTHWIADLPPPI